MNSANPLIDVANLNIAYQHGHDWIRVLHGVSFTIDRGEAFGLVGESGCGKSSVAYHLLGYQRENSCVEAGQIYFNGIELFRVGRDALDQLRGNRVSIVPQNPTTALSPGMRVGRQITEVLQFHNKSRGEEPARVVDLFRLVRLPNPEMIGRRYPHQLSGGQQQRVCIAMALACEPDLLVLDEPTTGLDVTTQEQIIELLADLRSRLGMSMFYVTHDLGVLAQLANRIGVMYAGSMVEIAPTATLFATPQHPYTRGLIASMPRIDGSGQKVAHALRGHLKRDELPLGCPFQPRCDFTEPTCATTVQRLESVGDGHLVACQRWQILTAPARDMLEVPATSKSSKTARKPVLRLDGLHIGYGTPRWPDRLFGPRAPVIVDDISFTIEAGKTFALVGESGSGKSTVARAVSGLLIPRSGTMLFEGKPLPGSVMERSTDLRRRIQYIFQNPDASLNPRAKVGAIVARPVEEFFKLDRSSVELRVAQALSDVRLDISYVDRFPDQLSGGERQRVAIARALAAEPELLLCDEILSALDVSVQASVLALLRRLQQARSLSMLFISHDLAVVRNLADQVGILFHGRLMEIGAVEEVFAPPFHPYTHQLLMAIPSARAIGKRGSLPVPMMPTFAGTKGCVFAGRCPWQVGRVCETETPPWRKVGKTLSIRCHITPSELTDKTQWKPDSEQRSTIHLSS
jgi:peptide/nickel transport system ATP-binding protein